MSKISQPNNTAFPKAFLDFVCQAGNGCKLRFAPTPSGFLHTGNALNFTLNWLTARLNNGSILLRIDDLDSARKRDEYVQDIFDSLHWLGLDWDEGPGISSKVNPTEDFETSWSQSNRLDLYFQLLQVLRSKNLLFACKKSRSELARYMDDYPKEFRGQNLSLDDEDVAWRIKSSDPEISDFIVRRRDGIPAYQVASLADDIHFGITHIIRGNDLETSTRNQQYIANCLGLNSFLQVPFLHHPLLTDGSGLKLSKSDGADSLKSIRESGKTPEQIFLTISELLQLSPAHSAEELLSNIGRVISN